MGRDIYYKDAFDKICSLVADYLAHYNLKTMVVGMSGGIDSTVVAAICKRVVMDNPSHGFKLVGVSLPCDSNTDEENHSAWLAMNAFCDEWWIESLQKEYMLMKSTCELHAESTMVSQGNIKARLRMIYLYNLACVRNGIVMDTSNMSENMLGFWTLHGDVGDLAPLSSLWKHEVYNLAREVKLWYESLLESKINGYEQNALENAIAITPTDGNGVSDGGDMMQIAPYSTYQAVDVILEEYISCIKPWHKLWETEPNKPEVILSKAKMGELNDKYGEATVGLVIKRHMQTEFKRHGMPVKIQTLGHGGQ